MKTSNKIMRYLIPLVVLCVFLVLRIRYISLNPALIDIELHSLAASFAGFPFKILRYSLYECDFLPLYYYFQYIITLIFKSVPLIRLFEAAVSCYSIFIIFRSLKKHYGLKYGVLTASFLSVSHYFMFYSSLIAPYCYIILAYSLVISALMDFSDNEQRARMHSNASSITSSNTSSKISLKGAFRKLLFSNIFLLLLDKCAVLFVLLECFTLCRLSDKTNIKRKKLSLALSFILLILILVLLPFMLFQNYHQNLYLIKDLSKCYEYNINGLYLLLNEFVTPYLSFSALESQSNSTTGLIYGYFLNPNIFNINSLKILLTLFFSSILPMGLGIWMFFRVQKLRHDDLRLKTLSVITLLNFSIILLLGIFHFKYIEPARFLGLFLIIVCIVTYGIFTIKNKILRILIIISFLLFQVFTPKIDCFNIFLDKKYPASDILKIFSNEYKSAPNALFLAPNLGQDYKLYFNHNFDLNPKLNIIDFDYNEKLFLKGNQNILAAELNYTDSKGEKLSKKNIRKVLKNYISENTFNDSIERYFVPNDIKSYNESKNIVLFVDKLNSRPVSLEAIEKCINSDINKEHLTKITFKIPSINRYSNKMLLSCAKSKTLYNLIDILKNRYFIYTIIQYKKMGPNTYYKVENRTNNIYKEINSYASDYVFIVFGKMLY